MLRCLGRSRQSGRFFLKLINNSFCLRSNLKHSTQCFITRLNISKFVKNTPLRVVFSTLLAAFHLVMKHCLSCLLYYLKTWLYGTNYNSSKGEHAFLKVTNNVRFMFCMYSKACMYDALIPNTDHRLLLNHRKCLLSMHVTEYRNQTTGVFTPRRVKGQN